jgi:hypothetical protein
MATAIVARKFIDNGVHEPGSKIEVTEARLAELVRMGLVVDPSKPAEDTEAESTDPATDAAKKGKK